MSYIPELRKSLVKAAERQATGAEATVARPSRRRVRRPYGAFALMAASVLAIVVAGMALVLLRHPTPTPSDHRAAAPTQADLRATAQSLLDQFTPPAGASAASSNPAPRGPLGGAPDRLVDKYRVDLHRFYRVPGTPQQVIDAIGRRPPLGVVSQGGSAAGSASSASGNNTTTQITFSGTTFDLRPANGIERQLAFQAVSLPGGASALRVDAQAGYQRIQERLPQSIVVEIPAHTSPGAVSARSIVISSPARRARAMQLLSALPAAARDSLRCRYTSRPSIAILLGTSWVFVHPGCSRVEVLTSGRVELKTWRYATTIGPGDVTHLIATLTGTSTASPRPGQAGSSSSKTASPHP